MLHACLIPDNPLSGVQAQASQTRTAYMDVCKSRDFLEGDLVWGLVLSSCQKDAAEGLARGWLEHFF